MSSVTSYRQNLTSEDYLFTAQNLNNTGEVMGMNEVTKIR